MLVLLDTNVALRLLDQGDPKYPLVRRAAALLSGGGARLCFVPQNVVEFWAVCTRPLSSNGLGLTVAETDKRARMMERDFVLLPDSDQVHAHWRRLVVKHSVSGAQVHDARLAAAMMAHGVHKLLTFNARDFRRYGIEVMDPAGVLEAEV